MTAELQAAARDADVAAWVHARDIDGDAETGLAADAPVVLASVFKLPVLVAVLRAAATGEVDLAERVLVRPQDHVPGPTGLSVMSDDVELSLRDLVLSMMTVSDNTATDIVLARIGIDRVNGTLQELGLERTRLVTNCLGILDGLAREMGAGSASTLAQDLQGVLPEELARRTLRSSALDPSRTNAGTPREITRLLQLIWKDEAGTPPMCEEARRILGLQVWPHRLRSGFGDEVRVSGKTGTLPYVRNEAGVVELPDGGRYAVAVFLRTPASDFTAPEADRAIGRLAHLAIDGLRPG